MEIKAPQVEIKEPKVEIKEPKEEIKQAQIEISEAIVVDEKNYHSDDGISKQKSAISYTSSAKIQPQDLSLNSPSPTEKPEKPVFTLPERDGDFWGNYEKNLGIVKENKSQSKSE